MEQKKFLEVGDIIYSERFDNIGDPVKIDRVTKAMAMSSQRRFHRGISKTGRVKEVGSLFSNFIIESPDIIEKRKRKKLLEFRFFKFETLTDDQLKRIISIIKEDAKNVPSS